MRGLILFVMLAVGVTTQAANYSDFTPQEKMALELSSTLQNGTTNTYALNSALTNTASSSIDLASYGGVYIQTSASASCTIEVQMSNTDTAALYRTQYLLPVGLSGFVKKTHRYVRFVNHAGNAAGTKVSLWYNLASDKISLDGGTNTVGSVISHVYEPVKTPVYIALNACTTTTGTYGTSQAKISKTAGVQNKLIVQAPSDGPIYINFDTDATIDADASVKCVTLTAGTIWVIENTFWSFLNWASPNALTGSALLEY